MMDIIENRLIEKLVTIGFRVKESDCRKLILSMNSIEIILIDQKFEGIEFWINYLEIGKKVRLDFILEYYLSGSTELTRIHKQNRNSWESYYLGFIERYSDTLFFNNLCIKEYDNWLKVNSKKIPEIRASL